MYFKADSGIKPTKRYPMPIPMRVTVDRAKRANDRIVKGFRCSAE